MKTKKISIILVVISLVITCFSACGTAKKQTSTVYYLNFKPEAAAIWEEIAAEYQRETGVEVKILTAASGNYDQTLKAEIAKREMPTIFQINGPVGYSSWKNYCVDLKDTELYSWLMDKDMAVTDGDGVYGIPYVVEGYGIIYNNSIMNKYFSSGAKSTSYKSMDEINTFDKLKEVVEDMTRIKEQLGIQGVFASTSFSSGEDWRWQTHLANLPVYYEFRDKGISDSSTLDFTYSENYRNIFDLYIEHSVTDKTELAGKTVNDSMEEFALGNCAMVQNGNWAWGQISSVKGNVVKEEDVKFLPIYTGVKGEESQGICIGTENFICINKLATKEQQKASIAFIEWVYSSDIGKDYVTNKFGFISPFNTFSEAESPTDPLAKEVLAYMGDESKYSVSWNFTAFPNQKFKDDFGSMLLYYCKGEVDYEGVSLFVKETWAEQKAAK